MIIYVKQVSAYYMLIYLYKALAVCLGEWSHYAVGRCLWIAQTSETTGMVLYIGRLSLKQVHPTVPSNTHHIIRNFNAKWASARGAPQALDTLERTLNLIFWLKFPAGRNATHRRCGFTADTVQLIFSTKRCDITMCSLSLTERDTVPIKTQKGSLEFQLFVRVKCGCMIFLGVCLQLRVYVQSVTCQAWTFTCRSKSSGNWRRWGQSWE